MDITVIIPVKNRRKHIERMLDGLARSTIQPGEIIIVDNGSTDGTLEFCREYAERHKRTTLTTEDRPGAAAARNKGLALCKTEWVYFFDSDDDFDTNFIASISSLNADGRDMIAVPTKMIIDGHETTRAFIASSDPRIQILANVLNTLSMVFRTSFVRAIGGWNEQCMIWDDWELGLRALLHKANILWHTEQAFHTIMIHPDSITGASFSSRYEHILTALSIAMDEIKELEPQMLVPLCYRTAILLGKVMNEPQSDQAEQAIRSFATANFRLTLAQRLFCRFLTSYSSHGGRGAWRIAFAINH